MSASVTIESVHVNCRALYVTNYVIVISAEVLKTESSILIAWVTHGSTMVTVKEKIFLFGIKLQIRTKFMGKFLSNVYRKKMH